jgi:hypothetical protein
VPRIRKKASDTTTTSDTAFASHRRLVFVAFARYRALAVPGCSCSSLGTQASFPLSSSIQR